MGKRRKASRGSAMNMAKRVRLEAENFDQTSNQSRDSKSLNSDATFHIEKKDKVDRKVDIIVKDVQNNSYRSLTIWGAGLGVEKTIAVVEELKRNYLKRGLKYTQDTSIKSGDDGQPHLQVMLTLHEPVVIDMTS